MRTLALFLALVAGLRAEAATRRPFGGTLRLLTTAPQAHALAFVPESACTSAERLATSRRLSQSNANEVATWSSGIERLAGDSLELRLAFQREAEARAALDALRALSASPSPYRALLAPVARRADGTLHASVDAGTLSLSLTRPWPDAAKDLSHPAASFAGDAAFVRGRTALDANPDAASGRPFLDRLSVERKPLRSAERAVLQGRADLGLGLQGKGGVQRLTTYAVLSQALADDAALRAAVESGLPDQAWTQVLVSPTATVAAPPARGSGQRLSGTSLHITFDQAESGQKALAERLQLRLSEQGAKVSLRPLATLDVLRAWNNGDTQVLIMSLLLPSSPDAANAVRAELSRSTLEGDVRKRTLPVFAQGCPVRQAPHVGGVHFEAHGLPLLEELYVVPK